MRKWIVAAFVGVILGFVFLRPDENLHVVACDVGQGDGILIYKGSNQVLVDGGPNDSVLSCLSKYMPFWDRELELVVMTNGDSDHMTGLIEVIKRYEVGKLVANNLVKETERFKALREVVAEERVEVYGPEKRDEIRIGGALRLSGSSPFDDAQGRHLARGTQGDHVERGRQAALDSLASLSSVEDEGLVFKVLWPEERLGDSLVWAKEASEQVLGVNTYSKTKANEQSVVMLLDYGEFEVLLTGDIGEETERFLMGGGLVEDVEVLKVGHHGSKYSSSETFLNAVRPEIAVVSSGKNRYGHPTPEALERLKAVGARVLRTDKEGDVEVVSDGRRYWLD